MLMPSIFGENLFDDWMRFPTERQSNAGYRNAELMKTDIKETDAGYELEIDLPGFTKDEVSAELNNGYLTVSAAKGLDQDEQEKDTGRYIRRERYAGSCQRSFYVGKDLEHEDIHAKYDNGVLTVTFPKEAKKKEPEEKKFISIEG